MAQQVAIIVVGSTMIDMMTYAERVPAAGETLVGERFSQGFGGKGANQAVMASRLGAAVAMVNCVGDDVFGDMTLENLTREGIDVTSVSRVAGVSSGVAPIWVEADGTNRIIVVPGANNHVSPEQARTAVEAAAEVHLVLGQFEIPQAATASAFAAGRRRGAVTVLNPAPAAELSPALLEVTDWLIPNEVEFAPPCARLRGRRGRGRRRSDHRGRCTDHRAASSSRWGPRGPRCAKTARSRDVMARAG